MSYNGGADKDLFSNISATLMQEYQQNLSAVGGKST
jgi:hypothetical protein